MNYRNYLLGCAIAWTLTAPAWGYVDISPTLGYLIKEADCIAVLRVEKIQVEKRVVLYEKIADLKGKFPQKISKHHLAGGFHPREPKMVIEWAEPGETAIAFISGRVAVVCIGRYWYQCSETVDGWWTMSTGRPELSLAYYGRTDQLCEALTGILAGKEVVVPAVNHGKQMGVWQYGNVAFRKVLRGKDCPVWRIKASQKMPDSVWEIGERNSSWVAGTGAVGTEDIPNLVRALRDSNRGDLARSHAATDLGLIGWKARPALPSLQKAALDKSPLVRIQAALAAALISEEYDRPLRELQKDLTDPSPIFRRMAAEAIGDLGSSARTAVPALCDALKDTEAHVRWAAADALGRIGPAASAAVPALANALRDEQIRVVAADALGAIGTASRGAVPVLVDAVKGGDEEFQWTSAIALSRIDAEAARVGMPLFIKRLQSDDLRARWDAMMFIAPMGGNAKEAAPAVLAMVKRGNGIAAGTLAAIAGPDAVEALPVLLRVLADDWDTSLEIAMIGKAAIPPLLKTLEDPELVAKHPLAIKTLGILSSVARDEVVPILIRSLKSPDAKVRKASATALATVDLAAVGATEALWGSLEDADPIVRLAAARALLARRAPEVDRAVDPLVELLAHEAAEVRRDAAMVLGDLGGPAKRALPALKLLRRDAKEAAVRSAAAWAVARIVAAEANLDAVAVLVQTLKDRDPLARRDAARQLGTIGLDARTACLALAEAKLDDDDRVRRAAIKALERINAAVGGDDGGE